jgi:hypothetical protein
MLNRRAFSIRQQLRPGRKRLDDPDERSGRGCCEIMLVNADAKWETTCKWKNGKAFRFDAYAYGWFREAAPIGTIDDFKQ